MRSPRGYHPQGSADRRVSVGVVGWNWMGCRYEVVFGRKGEVRGGETAIGLAWSAGITIFFYLGEAN